MNKEQAILLQEARHALLQLELADVTLEQVFAMAVAYRRLHREALDELYKLVSDNEDLFQQKPGESLLVVAVRKLKELVKQGENNG